MSCSWVSNRADISSALGALGVGLAGNIWGRMFQGTSFIVTAVPILFQLPSGLSNGGLLNFATTGVNGGNTWDSAFTVAQQLITVAIGLVVGYVFLFSLEEEGERRRTELHDDVCMQPFLRRAHSLPIWETERRTDGVLECRASRLWLATNCFPIVPPLPSKWQHPQGYRGYSYS
jgi:hypothetical protein